MSRTKTEQFYQIVVVAIAIRAFRAGSAKMVSLSLLVRLRLLGENWCGLVPNFKRILFSPDIASRCGQDSERLCVMPRGGYGAPDQH